MVYLLNIVFNERTYFAPKFLPTFDFAQMPPPPPCSLLARDTPRGVSLGEGYSVHVLS